jgi:predicted ArsR family transcriptional regulator
MSTVACRELVQDRVLALLEDGPRTTHELARELGISNDAAYFAAWRLAHAGCCRRAERLASGRGGPPRIVWEVEP